MSSGVSFSKTCSVQYPSSSSSAEATGEASGGASGGASGEASGEARPFNMDGFLAAKVAERG